MRQLTYYVGASIDGFIAAPSGAYDFYPIGESFLKDFLVGEYPECLPTPVRGHMGIDGVPNTHFDTVIQGRATYDAGLKAGVTSPYAHLRQYVVSRSITESPDPAVEILSGDVLAAVRELKAEEGGLGIYLAGGADLAAQLLSEIDCLIVKVYPIVIGSGIPLFSAEFGVVDFALDELRTFDNGTIVTKYARKR
ncbi:dihydrofolate reductase family protein [Streptomyces beijiangensis]|uniref:Dihydrofolate reductase family protein n=1 Tax=Streptomyces beijiangensis TaxID=163361 RepID=A0A939FBA0_9ACTN|nr:dihydrofolate reductase family protein [Streptomyces beijiangensis]MBO0513855.1 dihydrofolate reductase family protein [Streptomyces beijiangensis]